MCSGYPSRLNRTDCPKAAPQACFGLAGSLEDAMVNTMSIEEAHRYNDFALLACITKTAVTLAYVNNTNIRVEEV